MKAGIVIETWKLPIFERHLKQSSYTFKNTGSPSPGLLALTVETDNATALQEVLKAALREARMTGQPPTD